jgi:AcrR family transcriptional regulator
MNERSVIARKKEVGSQRRNKEQLTEQRRKQILDAALTVFSRKGYGESTIPDIAREAGVAVGTIYNYYQSKRDILVSALASNILSGPFLKATEGSPEANDKVFFESLIGDRLALLTENAEKFLFMLGEVYRDEEFRRRWAQEVVQPALGRVERYVGSKVASGTFRPVNASVTVRALAGMAIGFSVLSMVEGEESPCRDIPPEEVAAQLADIALMGVKAREGDSPE